MKYETVPTSALRLGDLVQNDMMRLRIDRELHQTHHAVDKWGKTWATSAVIENFQEIQEAARNGNDHAAFIIALADKRGADDGRWTIQGNDLARWSRIIENGENQ